MTTAPPRSLAPPGASPPCDLGDQPVLDPQPAALVLGARVVHRDDPRVAETVTTTLQRHELEAVDVDEPLVGELQRRDHREREERQVLERRLERAAELAAPPRRRRATARRPRRAARRRAARRPAAAAPPAPRRRRRRRSRRRRFASRRTAAAIAASFIPTTTTLCASWATVEASAPRCRPKPRTKPRPTRPVPRWRSTTAIFARSCVRVGDRLAGARRRLVDERVGDDLSRHDPDHARLAAAPGHPEHLRAEGADPHRVPHPVGHLGRAGSPRPAAPFFSTRSGTNRSRSGSTSRSAW